MLRILQTALLSLSLMLGLTAPAMAQGLPTEQPIWMLLIDSFTSYRSNSRQGLVALPLPMTQTACIEAAKNIQDDLGHEKSARSGRFLPGSCINSLTGETIRIDHGQY